MAAIERDTFADQHLPPRDLWPVFDLTSPAFRFPERLNCVVELLDRHLEQGHGDRRCILTPDGAWSYRQLAETVNRLANYLVGEMGMRPGNRVLLRAPNNPMMAAGYLAVMKAGGIAVGTMPMLRAGELKAIVDKAQISHALCDSRLAEELQAAAAQCPSLRQLAFFGDGPDSMDERLAAQPAEFEAWDSAADETCLIAFTSGTTGTPKGTMHFHRDILAICEGFSRQILKPTADDLFTGSPPIAFTFGLGGLVLFPLHVGAATLLLEKASPQELLAAIEKHRVSVLFTAPTAYRAMIPKLRDYDISSLRKGVSAGEHLPEATWRQFHEATGIRLIDGIGSTEMLHIFLSNRPGDVRYGTTGKPVPGYQVELRDETGHVLEGPDRVGDLFIGGPSAALMYWTDRAKSNETFRGAWTKSGDKYFRDPDGYYVYAGRSDDMLKVSGQYVSPFEVESTLVQHEAVLEAAVIGVEDEDGLMRTKAFVVLKDAGQASQALDDALKAFIKDRLAPHKYPRQVEFVDELPKTATGKIQRFRLRERERQRR